MQIAYKPRALGQLAALSSSVRHRIINKIEFYASQDDPLVFAKRLSGYGAYRFRVGSYRVIFDIESELISILLVLKRDKA